MIRARRSPGAFRRHSTLNKLGMAVAKVLTVVVATLLALVVSEIASRYLYHVEMAHFVDSNGKPTDILRNDPELEFKLKPDFRGRQVGSEFQVSISTNSLGFRDSKEFAKEKGGAYRILGLGDSITFGWGVEEDQAYLSRLGKVLESELGRKVETFNLGVWGYGTIQEVKVFRQFQDYKPDLVILEFFARNVYVEEAGNDLVDNYNFEQWYKTRDLPQEVRRKEREANRSHVNATKEFVAQHCNLCRIGVLVFGGFIRKGFHPRGNDQRTSVAWQITENELKEFDRDLGSMNIKCLLLWAPPLGMVQAKDDSVVATLRSFGLQNIKVISALDVLARSPEKYYYKLDTHWRPAGQEAVAEFLAQTIVTEGFLPSITKTK
jgi:lysophospholipase L1-like esterase